MTPECHEGVQPGSSGVVSVKNSGNLACPPWLVQAGTEFSLRSPVPTIVGRAFRVDERTFFFATFFFVRAKKKVDKEQAYLATTSSIQEIPDSRHR